METHFHFLTLSALRKANVCNHHFDLAQGLENARQEWHSIKSTDPFPLTKILLDPSQFTSSVSAGGSL
jgi:hypothetical protein